MHLPEDARQHPNFPNYFITPSGEVWSIARREPKKLSQFVINKKANYQRVGGKFGMSRNNTVRVNYYVHRLVAETFLPNPHNLTDVNHINGDKTDNCVSNLEWCSREDNMKDAWAKGYINTQNISEGVSKWWDKRKGGS